MQPSDFDLDAYLTRIGVQKSLSPSLSLLQEIIAGHAAAIPFENLDIILGRPIRLDIGSIQAKLVSARRGGYCFEQNTLLRAALEQLGFVVSSRMARVVRGAQADAITSRTHMLLRVDLRDEAYLADVGFGNLTPTAPLMLGKQAPQSTKHEDYRLQSSGGETLLQARLGTEWENIYRFSEATSHPIDHEVGNWFTSTKPAGLFTANVIAARPGPGCRKTLFNADLTIRDTDNHTDRWVLRSEAALEDALAGQFGIALDFADLATIFAAMRSFTDRPEAGFRLD